MAEAFLLPWDTNLDTPGVQYIACGLLVVLSHKATALEQNGALYL